MGLLIGLALAIGGCASDRPTMEICGGDTACEVRNQTRAMEYQEQLNRDNFRVHGRTRRATHPDTRRHRRW